MTTSITVTHAAILSGIVLGFIIVLSPYSLAFFILALVVVVALLSISSDPVKALSILIFLIPFSGTSVFRLRLMGLPGTEPLYLLAYFVTIIAIIHYRQSAKITKYPLFFTTLFLTIFSISIIHSLFTNMDTINLRRISAGEDPYSILEYLLQYFVRQLIYFIPFIFIIKFCKKISDLEYVINTLVLSIGLLAIFIIYSYLFGIEDRSSMEVVGETTSLIGLHRNAVADFFIAGFPIILARYFLKKNIINILVVWLSVVAIGFLYSRTAYGLLILSTVLYFYVSRRIKFSPLLIAIAIGLFFIIPSTIINRASKGLEVRDQEEVTSRIDHIWRPLIEEYAGDLKGLLFGRGRYAMLSSNAVATGLTPTTMMHPHNMYLEQILDVGIIGLVCMIWLFAILFRKVHRTLGTIQDYKLREYRCGMIVSIASYFIAGVTGRSFFPQLKNSFFWIIVGMTFVLIKLIQKSHENEAVLKHISVGEIRHPGSVQEKRFA